jgi:hypothetical protein
MSNFVESKNEIQTMRLEKYQTEVDVTSTIYEFVSKSKERSIKKRVIYEKFDNKNIFNLAFGDVNNETGGFDDLVVTNNGDSEKVLATVASTVYHFLDKYPEAIIFASGSTPARTRLYKIGISKNLEELEKDFSIMGLNENKKWVTFESNGSFSAFYLKRKNNL